jgi:phage-related protein
MKDGEYNSYRLNIFMIMTINVQGPNIEINKSNKQYFINIIFSLTSSLRIELKSVLEIKKKLNPLEKLKFPFRGGYFLLKPG